MGTVSEDYLMMDVNSAWPDGFRTCQTGGLSLQLILAMRLMPIGRIIGGSKLLLWPSTLIGPDGCWTDIMRHSAFLRSPTEGRQHRPHSWPGSHCHNHQCSTHADGNSYLQTSQTPPFGTLGSASHGYPIRAQAIRIRIQVAQLEVVALTPLQFSGSFRPAACG